MTLLEDAGTGMPVPSAGPRHRDAGGWAAGYARALWASAQTQPAAPAARAGEPATNVTLYSTTGTRIVLDIARFTAQPGPAEMELLDRCVGPTVDIGCGPGRLAAELAARGIPALGIDVSPVAVLLARAAGATALRRSIFDRLPGEGRWPHALLIDGNIGIGGDPAALLRRVRKLLRPADAQLLVETESADIDEFHRVRIDACGPEFGWARIGAPALAAQAEPLGYHTKSVWHRNGRCFTVLGV
ncbi:MAG TPA: class I SAM-dependent methyltransferase [Streptosporangiaceae bacterium]|nr:class I SAM-dependent methyltransferase [Streptosporangiaceae bacterium]